MRICSGKGNAMKDKQKEKEKEKELFGLFGEMDLEELNRKKDEERAAKQKRAKHRKSLQS